MLYKRTVHAAVIKFYRDGVAIKPQWPPLVGQLRSDTVKGVDVLHLWPLDWAFTASHLQPLATLWFPEFGRLDVSVILFKGLEAKKRGNERQWLVQKWECELLMSADAARRHLDPPKTHGEVKPSVFLPDQLRVAKA